MRILVLGATGYVGRHLIKRLLRENLKIRCLARNPSNIDSSEIEVIKGDAGKINDLEAAMKDIDVIYYLIHSMSSGKKEFVNTDKIIAQNVSLAASRMNVKRIIYLGALGERHSSQSDHLKSRHEVAEILRESTVNVTEFRAAVVVGNGSSSFEMIKYLVKRLPVMICPKWVNVRTQPIFIEDVLYYLVESLRNQETENKIIDIGGPDIVSYLDMMKIVASQLNLKRLFFSVPVLTPKLSSHWVNLVTPISSYLASALIESVISETVCENDLASRIFHHKPVSFNDAVKMSLSMS